MGGIRYLAPGRRRDTGSVPGLPGAVLAACLAAAVALGPAGAGGTDGTARAQSQLAPAAKTQGDVSGLPLPRFVSLRAALVNLRTGPGVRYPIEWVYNRAGLPLEVVDEFETWRKVRDWEGSVGWIHQSMLSGARKVMIRDRQRLMRREPDPAAPGVALLAPQVLADLQRCVDAWCEIQVEDKSGWLRRIDLYGLYPDENIR